MDSWESLLTTLTRLKESWPGTAWTWDPRFATIASSFSVNDEQRARTSAMHAFPRGWTVKSLESAPPLMQSVAARTGGLRASQRLLAGDEVAAERLFGLWWMWGDGTTVTLRIGIAGLGADDDPLPRLRALFDVTL